MPAILTFLFSTIASVVALAAEPLPNVYPETTLPTPYYEMGDTADADVSVLTPNQANELFHDLAHDPDIPYRYRVDGCYARATQMAFKAEAKNIGLAKVVATGFLRAKAQEPEKQSAVTWQWHVATVAVVDKNGTKTPMVFDPSLFNKPVTVKEWADSMKIDGDPKPFVNGLYFASRYQTLPADKEGAKLNWDSQYLDFTKNTLQFFKQYQNGENAIIERSLPLQRSNIQKDIK